MKEMLKTFAIALLTLALAYGTLWSWSYITGLHQVVDKLAEQNRQLSEALSGQCAQTLTRQGYLVTPPAK